MRPGLRVSFYPPKQRVRKLVFVMVMPPAHNGCTQNYINTTIACNAVVYPGGVYCGGIHGKAQVSLGKRKKQPFPVTNIEFEGSFIF